MTTDKREPICANLRSHLRSSAYRIPAEWEPHRSTWLVWPKNKSTWPGPLLKEAEAVYLQMIETLLPHEKVNLLVNHRDLAKKISRMLHDAKKTSQNLIFHEVKTTDVWIRDYGPIFVKLKKTFRVQKSEIRSQDEYEVCPPSSVFCSLNTGVAFTKWTFNAWGGKYSDLAKDNQVVDRIDVLKLLRRFNPPMILEGGSIDVNGRGACLTTEQCLLNPNRNAQFSRKKIERYLGDFLGVKKVIWLKKGIEGDDTDGHVDDIARFVDARTVVTSVEQDPHDTNYAALRENLKILKAAQDQDGNKFRLVELPMPGWVGPKKRRLPASYVNFYIANKAVLVPTYSHSHDKLALKILKKVFPGRSIIGIDCAALVHGLGSIHCVTQQEPE